jgi:CMP-N,N'-diacetyllegionaminic acid synthase
MQKKNINLALIAARHGSKGVKNKNLLNIKNASITKIAVNIGIKLKKINKVVLSSDSQKILDAVPNNEKLIKLKRKKSLARDTTPMLPVMQDAIRYFEKVSNYNYLVKNLVIIDPTSPLRNISDLKKAIKLFEKKKPDLLVSVHDAQHNPYFSIIEKKGKFYELSKKNKKIPSSRQEAPKTFEINTIVWIYSRRAIMKFNKRIPKKTIILKTPKERSIDIDNQNDINLINFYLKNEKKNIQFKSI